MDKYSLTEDGKTDYTKSSISRAEKQNSSILNNLPFFLIVTDGKGLITTANSLALKLFDIEAGIIEGKNISSILISDCNQANRPPMPAIEE